MLETVLDDPLVDQIRAIQEGKGEDFWSFKNASKRRGAHALIHYPAMMVPNLQGNILEAIMQASPGTTDILDPFVGSGTVLVESMSRGLNFTGVDINPLAALSCLVKSGPYYIEAFQEKVLALYARIVCDPRRAYYVDFAGRDKWFLPQVTRDISLIARNIETEPSLWARRLFWLALAKVVRACCNSRNSTYKLHAKKADPDAIVADPLKHFEDAIDSFVRHMADQHADWSEKGLLQNGRYTGEVNISLGDSSALLKDQSLHGKFDVVMTSPPYGDNRTTIPYGQYAYLPMKWISPEDVALNADQLLDNSYAIDTASLGGSTKNAADKAAALRLRYESVRRYAHALDGKGDGLKRFAAFFGDLDECVDQICQVTKDAGYQAWTIGSRRIQGMRVPMEDILEEMLAERDVATVGRIYRTIHAKKMAARNNLSATMNTETIVLAKKA
jgi:16S rRNA G966 N2-methylase RsmD